jgi:hypothetical protein
MPAPLTLNDVPPGTLMQDVYFRPDFLELHAPKGLDTLRRSDFCHGAVEKPIAGSARCDLETPWGYGGPLALDPDALAAGLAEWRSMQQARGRVAEFIRLHPFINPVALWGRLEMLEFNRPTVIVDLQQTAAERWNFYRDSTRNCLRKAQRTLTIRRLAAAEWPLFQALYEAGLERNEAAKSYFLSDVYHRSLLAQPWCDAWVAEDREGPIAASCFLHSGTPLCHYHLAGGNERSRKHNALYLLLDEAFSYYGKSGYRWMHLGGGRSSSLDDSLLAFKSKFSRDRAHFYIGGIVLDRCAYQKLGGGHERFLCAGSNPIRGTLAGVAQ